MELVKITEDQAEGFRQASRLDKLAGKPLRKLIWRQIKDDYGLPPTAKYKVAVTDESSPDYRVIRDKHTDSVVTIARSSMPYGSAALSEILPVIAHHFNLDRTYVPADARPLGVGMFVKGDTVYFPVY